MSLFKEVLNQIKINQSKEFNCLSWEEKFPRFSAYIPGISRNMYYAITGAPGSGKTQFTDNVFLYYAIDFARAHGIEIEVVYFSFEISKTEKMINGLSKRLFEAYGSRISKNQLMRMTGHTLDEIQLSKIHKSEQYFTEFERYVTFIDDRLTPSQMYKVQMDKIKENGTYDHHTGVYVPHNPDKYLIFITDHISLIPPDTGQTLHQALATFSSNNIYLKNRFGATIVNIHQQGVDSQVQQFNNKGDSVSSKLEPKLANLADNRTLGRDYDLVLGLFSPNAYELDFYRGYKAKKFGDRCRWLSIAKNRQGEQGHHVALYFDGAVGYFEELPRAEEFSVLKMGAKADNDALYEKYAKGAVGVLDPTKQKSFIFNT